MSPSPPNRLPGRLAGAFAIVTLGTILAATWSQTCLSSRQLSTNFISPATWVGLVDFNHPVMTSSNHDLVDLPLFPIFLTATIFSICSWLLGAAWLVFMRGRSWLDAMVVWGWYGWLWWCLLDLWEWLWIAAKAADFSSLTALLSVTPQFWLAGCVAGWLTTFLTLQSPTSRTSLADSNPASVHWLWLFCGVHAFVFITMNWQLYFNLLVPHGDSAMYEEHLWNLLHGKGFRSYLDRGLFLGEHIQFVHLFLLPLYLMWPSHLLLEACSTIGLSLGAFPVFWMTRRHTGLNRMALAVAAAYLLYFPMQFLDIEIDLKTFRPESFGIPLLLLTLDQLDRKNLVGTLLGIGFCLTVKEDYTLVFGPLGVWIALSRGITSATSPSEGVTLVERRTRFKLTHWVAGVLWLRGSPGRHDLDSGNSSKRVTPPQHSPNPLQTVHHTTRQMAILFGLSLSLFSVAYLWLAMRVIMPWFRSGDEVHYASYFARFGNSPEEILKTWLTQPGLVSDALFEPGTAWYAISLLAPLAFLPLLSPGRLAVGLPLFAILCLNELEGSRTPQHQFHAPLVAIFFWSLAAALPRAIAAGNTIAKRFGGATLDTAAVVRRLVWTSSLASGLFFSLGPLGIPFWDAGSSWYWKKLYVLNDRARAFGRVVPMIPQSARVASTDFVHPRFTHCERSYDYSDYVRKINGEGNRIPEDTDYIVIDTSHRYSKIKLPGEVPEFRDQPERWELMPDETRGNFIVLKRK